jgi:hypothetical protein
MRFSVWGHQQVGGGAHREHLAGRHRRPADESDCDGAGGVREAVVADVPAPRTAGKPLCRIEGLDGWPQAGSLTVIVVASSGVLMAATPPPWASAIPLTIANPSPAPLPATALPRCRALSAR